MLSRLDERRKASQAEDLEALYKRCLAMNKIANGHSYAEAGEMLSDEKCDVKYVTLKAWTRDFAMKLAEWDKNAANSDRDRRLSSRQMEAFLSDKRLAAKRKALRTAKKYAAIDLLAKYESKLPHSIPPWRFWKDADIVFFLRTGCVPPRVLEKKNIIALSGFQEGEISDAQWQELQKNWADDYPDGETWTTLMQDLDAVEKMGDGSRFRLIPADEVLTIGIRTAWTLQKEAGHKTKISLR